MADPAQGRPFELDVGDRIDVDPAWDVLAAANGHTSVFATSAWLAAWSRTLAPQANLRTFRLRHQGRPQGRLVAAAALVGEGGAIGFAGAGPSDYADVLIDPELPEPQARQALEQLLGQALDSGLGRYLKLNRIPGDSPTLNRLRAGHPPAVLQQRVEAPRMDMAAAPEVLGKKSLKRHDNGLKRKGEVTCETFRRHADVAPRLDDFFELHVRRWADTPTPSLFLEPANRAFYQAASQNLDALDALRFTEIRLDGRLVAAHYGFLWNGRFVWYKPCFEPELAKSSPGEVLIKRLVELALEEGAELFDFTLGGESFKHRFATSVPHVHTAEIRRGRLGRLLLQARHSARSALTSIRDSRRDPSPAISATKPEEDAP